MFSGDGPRVNPEQKSNVSGTPLSLSSGTDAMESSLFTLRELKHFHIHCDPTSRKTDQHWLPTDHPLLGRRR